MKYINILSTLLLCLFYSFSYSSITYVSGTSSGSNNGSSWENAYNSLQYALINSENGDTIWVAAGTYLPTENTDRTISFNIPNRVKVFGGFVGNESFIDQRDWINNPTILSGDIGTNSQDDNSFSVVYVESTDSTTTLDGLIIRGGHSNSGLSTDLARGPTKSGAAIYLQGNQNQNTNLRIENCTFENNYALFSGGAIFANGTQGATGIIILNSLFNNNTSGFSGGAIAKEGGCQTVQTIKNTIFNNNSTQDFGGAISFKEASVDIDFIIENCEFNNNSADLGGAIAKTIAFQSNSNNFIINNCKFTTNNSINFGAAISSTANSTGTLSINQSIFESNSGGEVIFSENIFDSTTSTISSCTFFNNENHCISVSNSDLFLLNNLFYKNNSTCIIPSDTVTILNNTFFKNIGTNGGVIEMNNDNGIIINTIFWENTSSFGNNFYLTNNSKLDIYNSVFNNDSIDVFISPSPFGTPSSINLFGENQLNIPIPFRDTSNQDFSLISCSSAINGGLDSLIISLAINTDINSNFRIINDTVDIGAYEQNDFLITLENTQDVSCKGFDDASIELNLSGTTPFNLISPTLGNITDTILNNLPPANYIFYFTDSDNCMDTLEQEITEPDSFLQVETLYISNLLCYGESNGQIEIQGLGGIPPYSYQWSNNSSSLLLDSLSSGVYSITFTDATNCALEESFEIFSPENLTAIFDVSNTSPDIQNGAIINDNIQGGTPPYSFEWSNGATTSSIGGLGIGTYNVTITDANQCDYFYEFQIDMTSSIMDNVLSKSISISPIPARNFINIYSTLETSNSYIFSLYNSNGKVVHSKILTGTNNRIETKELPAGTYFYSVKEATEVFKRGKILIAYSSDTDPPILEY